MSQFLTRQATAFSGLSPKRHTGGTFSTRLSPFWNLFSSPILPSPNTKGSLLSSNSLQMQILLNTEYNRPPKILKCKGHQMWPSLLFFELIVENATIRKRVCIHHPCVDYVNTLRVYASVSSHIVYSTTGYLAWEHTPKNHTTWKLRWSANNHKMRNQWPLHQFAVYYLI